jgi:hypothetical protein
MSAAHKELLNDVWGKTTCGDVMPKQNIIAIEANTSIEDACEVRPSRFTRQRAHVVVFRLIGAIYLNFS